MALRVSLHLLFRAANMVIREKIRKRLTLPSPSSIFAIIINDNMATQEEIATIELIIGYEFNDKTLLQQAFTAPRTHTNPSDGNRRLALLGDAVLRIALMKYWYLTPGATRGNARSRKKFARADANVADGNHVLQSVATNDNLNNIGRNANLASFVICNPSQAPGVISRRTMADTVEAILGAVYHDANINIVSVTPVMRNLGLGPV